jgi:hypothetical protein
MQCTILWALGRECFGITPARPLKSLLIQAENDDGDLAEMRDGVIAGLGVSAEGMKTACQNIFVVREDSRTSFDFVASVVHPLLAEHRPELLRVVTIGHGIRCEVNEGMVIGLCERKIDFEIWVCLAQRPGRFFEA